MSHGQSKEIEELEGIVCQQAEQIRQLQQEVDRLKALLEAKADAKAAKKPDFKDNYSLDRNKKANRKPKRKSTGRKPKSNKQDLASVSVNVYPQDVAPPPMPASQNPVRVATP
jgi:uncharacterized small protein (DUF1192 family)